MKESECRVCGQCGGEMIPRTVSKFLSAQGKSVEICGIQVMRCKSCGEEYLGLENGRLLAGLTASLSKCLPVKQNNE